ncbi:alanine racemase C-terminal domain-containing protein [Weissella coleopterorum]|uniref:alanine racemase C-terminal domain-containing protein n=1 Tax=Weissella coleopterorum TaxID=2714949 RepID=UPI0024836D8C|nr:alanine racemase C-terminal domain-containing protein [Weissella coleopterorum]
MDQLMVALPQEMPVGTVITLIGSAGDQHVTLEDLADRLGTIPYEVATSLSVRLPRYLVD